MKKLWRIPGGVHPPQHKKLSNGAAIRTASIPRRLILPLHQHIGTPAHPVVAIGDKVFKGQVIGRAEGFVSAPVHASSSGKVVDISEQLVAHPSGMKDLCITIETDGRDEWLPGRPGIDDYSKLSATQLRGLIAEAGIVGLGGATFPSFIKLNPGPEALVDRLILNGAECEPFITSDEMMMLERSAEITQGLLIMRQAVQARDCLIAIEDNKPAALQIMRTAVAALDDPTIKVVSVPTLYPTGGEKQLIKILTGLEVPSGKLPLEVGVICHNMSTAAAIYRAICLGEPLVRRVVTVTGQGVSEPQNLDTPFGTPLSDLIAQAGGYTSEFNRLILGGPMMGFAIDSDLVPLTKGTNCVLVAAHADVNEPASPMPCIRCGRCATACPMNLLPQQMYWHSRAKEFEKAQDFNLFDCIECGCCSYVCPSQIPLVHYFRYGKTQIRAQEQEQRESERARARHEARIERLAREKAKREEKTRLLKEAAKNKQATDSGKDEARKAAIGAAISRVQQNQVAVDAGDEPAINPQRSRIRQIETGQTLSGAEKHGAGGE